jgi:ankyrin repeat protein
VTFNAARVRRANEVGPDGKTALMFAAMFDRVDVVAALLARGARPGRRDGAGRRALDYAEAMGAARAAAALGKAPAPPPTWSAESR